MREFRIRRKAHDAAAQHDFFQARLLLEAEAAAHRVGIQSAHRARHKRFALELQQGAGIAGKAAHQGFEHALVARTRREVARQVGHDVGQREQGFGIIHGCPLSASSRLKSSMAGMIARPLYL